MLLQAPQQQFEGTIIESNSKSTPSIQQFESITIENNSKSEYSDPDLDALLVTPNIPAVREHATIENNSKSDKENNCPSNSRFGHPQRESNIKFINENCVPKNNEKHKLGSANLTTLGYKKTTAAIEK